MTMADSDDQRALPSAIVAVRSNRALSIAIGVLIIAAGLASLVMSFRGQWRLDFASDWATTHAVREGDSPYGNALAEVRRRIPELRDEVTDPNQGIFPNWRPPFRFILALPFTFLAYGTAANVWTAMEAMALVLALFLIGRSLGWRRGPSITVAIGALTLLSVRQDLGLGQINGLLVLLLTVCWLGLRNDRPDVAGIALGACIAIKIFPAFLLVPIVLRRHMRVALVAMGTAGVLTLAGII
ncbi:MAG: glycosyltransferase family 87 protein, partial [Gammaproteobacteria bacterium]